jgi:putative peptidoglycan lipid II flippase
MRVLASGVADGAVHDREVQLGAFLLWFFLPQIVLYAIGAVATALLNADRRFTAAAVAPVFNNVVVIATMIAFRAARHGSTAFGLTGGQKLILALGTTGGVVAMTVVPLLAVWRDGLALVPWWSADAAIGALVRKGMWAAGHLGLNEVLGAVTIVLAARVHGGVVAYQIAFTFFLLPHAVLSNPIFTTLYPRLAADAVAGRREAFAADLATGVRYTAFLLLPSAVLLAATARPVLEVVRLGALDRAGAGLVAAVLAAYAVGLLGYSVFFLLTRAAYALDDVRSPTIVNLVATTAAVVGMFVASSLADERGKVVVLGLVHGAAVSAASVALYLRLRSRLGYAVPVLAALARGAVASAAAGLAAWGVVTAVGTGGRVTAAGSIAAATVVGVAVYAAVQRAAGAPELRSPLHAFARVAP